MLNPPLRSRPRWSALALALIAASAALADTPAHRHGPGGGGGGGGGQPTFGPTPEPERRARPGDTDDEPGQRVTRVDLRPRFEVGRVVRYVMTIDGTNDVAGTQQKMKQELTLSLRALETHPENGSLVGLLYERVKISIDADGEVYVYDSENPRTAGPQNPLAALAGQLAGTSMRMRIDVNGQITKVEGGANLSLPGALQQVGALPGSAKGLSDIFGPIRTHQSSNGLVDKGDVWTHRDTLDVFPLGSFTIAMEYRLLSHRRGVATVKMDGAIEPASEGDDQPAQGRPKSPLKMGPSSLGCGRYTWDTARGELISMEYDQCIDIETSGPAGMPIPGGGGLGGPDGLDRMPGAGGLPRMVSRSRVEVQRVDEPKTKPQGR